MFTENNKFQYAYIKRQALLGMAPTTRLVFWWMGLEANLTSQRWNATGINVMMHTENICLYKNVCIMPFPQLAERRQGRNPSQEQSQPGFILQTQNGWHDEQRWIVEACRMKAAWQDLLLRRSGCSYWISKSLLCHLKLDTQRRKSITGAIWAELYGWQQKGQ